MVVFGTQAFLQAPFTVDHDLVRDLLDRTRPRLAGPQTMIGDAIGLTIKAFENSDAEDRVLILLTDGNDSGSKVPPKKTAEIAARDDIVIHTVAVGDPGSSGESEMDLETLEAIAQATGGQAFRADDRKQLDEIYRQIDALTPVDLEVSSYRPTRPLFHWPLGAVVALLLGYHLLMGRRAGRPFDGSWPCLSIGSRDSTSFTSCDRNGCWRPPPRWFSVGSSVDAMPRGGDAGRG